MKVFSRVLAASALTIFVLAPVPLQTAGQTEGAEKAYEEITWERLLPDGVSGKAFPGDAAADDKKPASYFAERDNAPANPALQGKKIKIHGFVVPLERDDDSFLTEFLLVPYFGACIHVPPPPQNQTIHVTLAQPATGIQAMDTVWVYGGIDVGKDSPIASGAAYSIRDAGLEEDAVFSPFAAARAAGLTLLCGMSLCLGWVGPFATIRRNCSMVSLGMAFAAGIMTCLGASAVIAGLSTLTLCLFFLGAALTATGEFLLHGGKRKRIAAGEKAYMGSGPALAVALHNFPESILIFSSAMENAGVGLVFGAAMIAHNIPLGIALGISSGETLRRNTAGIYALLAGIAPSVAAIAGYFSLKTLFSAETMQALFACAGGALVFIALAELVPSARRYGGRLRVFTGFSAGAAFLLSILSFSYRG
jgi:zinc transporter ZupT